MTNPRNYYPKSQAKEGVLLFFCERRAAHFLLKLKPCLVIPTTKKKKHLFGVSSHLLPQQHPKPATFNVPPAPDTWGDFGYRSAGAFAQPECFMCFPALGGSLLSGIIPSIRYCPGTGTAGPEATTELTAQCNEHFYLPKKHLPLRETRHNFRFLPLSLFPSEEMPS